MGDMADYYLDSHDWFDEDESGPPGVGCKYCGEGYFFWGDTPKGFRLFNEHGKMHTCLTTSKEKKRDAS